jgi:Ser/Thr protein kinase RdoA (MazF antagonist)
MGVVNLPNIYKMIPIADPRRAAVAFSADGGSCPLSPLGCGNINDTFLVQSAAGPFVLQRINRSVFPEPLRVINNFAKITSHLADKRFRIALPVPTLSGVLYFRDDQGDYWRGQTYLPHINLQRLTSEEQAWQIGRALASFHLHVADLDVQHLEDPLPGFHNLSLYLQEFDRLRVKKRERVNSANGACLDVISQYRQRAMILEETKVSGMLTMQTIHGDPKIDNFLFDDKGLADGMLDLDTVGGGLVHYDLGDCLRSCCNRVGEGGTDNLPVFFDMQLCRALLQGYFSEGQQLLSAEQRAYIYDAVLAITFELGLRFFTDHLRGNTYFKVRQDGDNMTRAIRQFNLLQDIVANEREIRFLATSLGCRQPTA